MDYLVNKERKTNILSTAKVASREFKNNIIF
jgi:hypothetical protein